MRLELQFLAWIFTEVVSEVRLSGLFVYFRSFCNRFDFLRMSKVSEKKEKNGLKNRPEKTLSMHTFCHIHMTGEINKNSNLILAVPVPVLSLLHEPSKCPMVALDRGRSWSTSR